MHSLPESGPLSVMQEPGGGGVVDGGGGGGGGLVEVLSLGHSCPAIPFTQSSTSNEGAKLLRTLQRSSKRLFLGCANSPPRPEAARRREHAT